MSKWKPIESAPKDGTEIITLRADKLVSAAIWVDGEWQDIEGCYLLNVTHWQPLPKPPEHL